MPAGRALEAAGGRCPVLGLPCPGADWTRPACRGSVSCDEGNRPERGTAEQEIARFRARQSYTELPSLPFSRAAVYFSLQQEKELGAPPENQIGY